MSPLVPASLLVGLGIYLLVTALPWGAPRAALAERLRRFDVDAGAAARSTWGRPRRPWTRWPSLEPLLRPLLEDLGGPVRWLRAPLARFGRDLDRDLELFMPDQDAHLFLLKQLVEAVLVGALPLLLEQLMGWQLGPAVVWLVPLGALIGLVLPYGELELKRRERQRRLVAELPPVLSLLSLAVSAGLGLDAALARASRQTAGLLGDELRWLQAEVALGHRSLGAALTELGARNRTPEITVLADLLHTATDQGFAVVDALEVMTASLEERRANRLLEEGGKGELKMLFPLALVIFPVTLAIVLVPGLSALSGLLGS